MNTVLLSLVFKVRGTGFIPQSPIKIPGLADLPSAGFGRAAFYLPAFPNRQTTLLPTLEDRQFYLLVLQSCQRPFIPALEDKRFYLRDLVPFVVPLVMQANHVPKTIRTAPRAKPQISEDKN